MPALFLAKMNELVPQKNMTVKYAKRQVKPYNDQNHKQQIQPPHVTFAQQTSQPINL